MINKSAKITMKYKNLLEVVTLRLEKFVIRTDFEVLVKKAKN